MVKELKKGEKFGYLTVLGEKVHKGKNRYEKCRCICGIEKYMQHHHLISGEVRSCGCMRKELSKQDISNRIINDNKYYIRYLKRKWGRIKARCTNKNNNLYGGRGVQCEWETSDEFIKDMGASFVEHIKKHGIKNTTIDRIDSNGNYCKENCRWATWKVQARNTRKNVSVTYKGETFPSITALCEHLGIDDRLVQCRMKRGRSIESAIEKGRKDGTKGFEIEYNGKKYKSHRELCRDLGISKDRVSRGLRHGFTLEESIIKKTKSFRHNKSKCTNSQT